MTGMATVLSNGKNYSTLVDKNRDGFVGGESDYSPLNFLVEPCAWVAVIGESSHRWPADNGCRGLEGGTEGLERGLMAPAQPQVPSWTGWH